MLNRCSGMAFGVAKKNFDEIDRAGFGGFVKKVRAALLHEISGASNDLRVPRTLTRSTGQALGDS